MREFYAAVSRGLERNWRRFVKAMTKEAAE
jgi:hypothetical protein